MRNYQKQYTFQKELRFLVLFAIKKLTEKLNARGKLEVQDNPVPLHSIAEKLQENKKIWNSYDIKMSFEDKLSEALKSLRLFGCPQKADAPDLSDDQRAKKAAIYLVKSDGGWYRGEAFDSSLKAVALELADVMDLNTGNPIDIKEPEYETIHITKETIMTYSDFRNLEQIVNEDIYKVIGRTTFEQSQWLCKTFGKDLDLENHSSMK